MRSHGIEFIAQTLAHGPETEIPTPAGVLALAEQYGYDDPPVQEDGDGRDQSEIRRRIGELSPDDQQAYRGVLEGPVAWMEESDGALAMPPENASGCEADARRAVLADLPISDPGFVAEVGALFASVDGAAELDEAVVAWSTCMREAGHDLSVPGDARARAANLTSDGARRLAVVDAQCATATTMRTQQRLEFAALSRVSARFPSVAEHLERIEPRAN